MPLLDTEASVFRDTMMQVVSLVKQRHDLALALAEADKAKPAPPALTTMVWQQIGNNVVASSQWPEYRKVAQISLVLVGGSVEDERIHTHICEEQTAQPPRRGPPQCVPEAVCQQA